MAAGGFVLCVIDTTYDLFKLTANALEYLVVIHRVSLAVRFGTTAIRNETTDIQEMRMSAIGAP